MADALIRWQERCRVASSTGEGLEDLRRDQRRVRAGVKAAVRAACRGNGAGDPLRCLERASVVFGKRLAWDKDVAWTGGYRVALRWLREEIARGGAPVADCAHQSPDLCVSWDYPMITVDGTEYQIAGWCCECGALRVFAADNLDEERWLLPRKGAPRG